MDTILGAIGGAWDFLTGGIGDILNGLFGGLIELILQMFTGPIQDLYHVINAVVCQPITEFGQNTQNMQALLTARMDGGDVYSQSMNKIVNILKSISNNALLPIAGLLLAYILFKFIYETVTDRNRTGELTSWDLANILIRVCVAIIIVTHAWDIVLGFWEMGSFMVNKAIVAVAGDVTTNTPPMNLENTLNDALDPLIAQDPIGAFLGGIVYIIGAAICGLIAYVLQLMLYIVVITRFINFLIYCSFAPVAFASLIDRSWLGNVGQNYIKNLMAFALQGFFLVVILSLGNEISMLLVNIAGVGGAGEVDMGAVVSRVILQSVTGGLNTMTLQMLSIVGLYTTGIFITVKLCQGSMGIAKQMVGAQ